MLELLMRDKLDGQDDVSIANPLRLNVDYIYGSLK